MLSVRFLCEKVLTVSPGILATLPKTRFPPHNPCAEGDFSPSIPTKALYIEVCMCYYSICQKERAAPRRLNKREGSPHELIGGRTEYPAQGHVFCAFGIRRQKLFVKRVFAVFFVKTFKLFSYFEGFFRHGKIMHKRKNPRTSCAGKEIYFIFFFILSSSSSILDV